MSVFMIFNVFIEIFMNRPHRLHRMFCMPNTCIDFCALFPLSPPMPPLAYYALPHVYNSVQRVSRSHSHNKFVLTGQYSY